MRRIASSFALLTLLAAGCATAPRVPQGPEPPPDVSWRGWQSWLAAMRIPWGDWMYLSIDELDTEERANRGLTIVLPGIEGPSSLNTSIALGLDDGGVKNAIVRFDWTTGHRANALYHLMSEERNRAVAKALAHAIVVYQDRYPGRPVHLVGHSGGGGLAILTLESLPPGRTVNSAVLLAAAISPTHDLRVALNNCDRGVWNFYSRRDAFFLGLGTTMFGTIDRRFGLAAGHKGFEEPPEFCWQERDLYHRKLFQQAYDWSMFRDFNPGGHYGCTNRVFVSKWVAPILAQ